jgi:hypothetical protein
MTSGAGLACLVTVVEDPPNEREREERDHTKIEKKRSNNSLLCGTRVWCNGLISDESPKRKSFERGKWFDGWFDAHPPPTTPRTTIHARPISTATTPTRPSLNGDLFTMVISLWDKGLVGWFDFKSKTDD